MNLQHGIPDWKQGSNINTLEVPPELDDTLSLPKKHPMAFFDDVMGGEGLTPSQVVMFTGDSGVGKTTLTLGLANAYHGKAKSVSGKKVIVIYNTQEESLYQVRRTVRRLKLGDGFIAGQDRMLGGLLNHVDNVQKQHKNARVIVIQDSLQALDDGHYKDGGITSGTNIRCLEAIIKHAKEKWSTWLVIGQVTKSGEASGKNALIHACDAHLTFRFDTAKKSPTAGERLMRTVKNRFGCAGITHVLGMTEDGVFSKGRMLDIINGDVSADSDEE